MTARILAAFAGVGLAFHLPAAIASQAAPPVQPPRWSPEVLQKGPAWYASAEARAIADSVIQYQSPQGGWPKSINLASPPRTPEDVPPPGSDVANTIDNGATTTPIRFLALVTFATGDRRYRSAVERGLRYLLAAQYPNGGWPQYYPLRDGYYSRITYNDDAMVNVLEILRDVAGGRSPFAFVDRGLRETAAAAVARGIDVILRTQVRQGGRLTGWCAQYDETTLAPAWARNYEPPSLSGNESVGIVRFLMGVDRPSPAVVAAIEGAVAWLRSVAMYGLRVEDFTDDQGRRDRRTVADSTSGPLWARFYELGTDRPIFTGRDRVIRYDYGRIEQERRSGYQYFGTWPAGLLASDYPRWRASAR
jgi:PelA/Pel-15E family pectate lyase